MRADMAKVLVERPRCGGQYSRKGRAQTFDLLPAKEGMRRRWTDHKGLNENLSPLRRFLASRVGRRWDTVYAEISEHLTPSNAVQQHVRSHLSWFVALKLRASEEGTLADHEGRSIDWRHTYDFYVDPRDGILKRSLTDKAHRREAQQRQQQLATRRATAEKIVIGPMSELHRINGVWYRIEFALFPSGGCRLHAGTEHVIRPSGVYDVLRRTTVTTGERYAASKRQLTARELRQHGASRLTA